MKEAVTAHEALKLGRGINSINLETKGFALSPSTPVSKPNKKVESRFFLSSTLREVENTLEASLGVSGPQAVGSITAGLTSIRKSQTFEFYSTLAISCTESIEMLDETARLNPIAIAILKEAPAQNRDPQNQPAAQNQPRQEQAAAPQGNADIEQVVMPLQHNDREDQNALQMYHRAKNVNQKFAASYGDAYVNSITYGRWLFLVIQFHFESREQLTSVKTELSALAGNVTVNAKFSDTLNAKLKGLTYSIHVFSGGVDLPKASLLQSENDLGQLINSFSIENQKSPPTQVQWTYLPYHTLALNEPSKAATKSTAPAEPTNLGNLPDQLKSIVKLAKEVLLPIAQPTAPSIQPPAAHGEQPAAAQPQPPAQPPAPAAAHAEQPANARQAADAHPNAAAQPPRPGQPPADAQPHQEAPYDTAMLDSLSFFDDVTSSAREQGKRIDALLNYLLAHLRSLELPEIDLILLKSIADSKNGTDFSPLFLNNIQDLSETDGAHQALLENLTALALNKDPAHKENNIKAYQLAILLIKRYAFMLESWKETLANNTTDIHEIYLIKQNINSLINNYLIPLDILIQNIFKNDGNLFLPIDEIPGNSITSTKHKGREYEFSLYLPDRTSELRFITHGAFENLRLKKHDVNKKWLTTRNTEALVKYKTSTKTIAEDITDATVVPITKGTKNLYFKKDGNAAGKANENVTILARLSLFRPKLELPESSADKAPEVARAAHVHGH